MTLPTKWRCDTSTNSLARTLQWQTLASMETSTLYLVRLTSCSSLLIRMHPPDNAICVGEPIGVRWTPYWPRAQDEKQEMTGHARKEAHMLLIPDTGKTCQLSSPLPQGSFYIKRHGVE